MHYMCYKLQLATLTEEQTQRLGIVLPEFPPVILNHFNKCITKINTKSFPWNINPNVVLFILTAFILI